MLRIRFLLTSLCVWLVFAPPMAPQQRPCDAQPATYGPSRDLYCIELVPAPGITGASGRAELGHPLSPYTVAVGPDGSPRYQLVLSLAGLPPLPSLGPDYRSYVAWV